MSVLTPRTSFKSHLFEMTQTTPTCLWNDSADPDELAYSLDHGAVGANAKASKSPPWDRSARSWWAVWMTG